MYNTSVLFSVSCCTLGMFMKRSMFKQEEAGKGVFAGRSNGAGEIIG